MNDTDLVEALRKHWKLKDLPWEKAALEGCRAMARVGAGGQGRIYLSAWPEEEAVRVCCYVYVNDTTVERIEYCSDPDTAISRLRTMAVWALSVAEEPPGDDSTLSDAIGQRRLADERRALLSNLDRTPEDETKLVEIREELERRWGLWETEADRRNSDIINRVAARLVEIEEEEKTP